MLTTRRGPAALLLILFALLGTAPPAFAQALVFDSGHVDAFHVTAEGGTLALDLKEDVTGSGVRHAPEDTTLVVKDSAWSEDTAAVPGIGQATYYLPQTQDPDLVWPGWDTQAVAAAGFTSVDLNFEQVTGPGEVFVFETGGLGGVNPVLNDASLALGSGSVVTQANPAHRHVNWAFTEPGEYTMTVSASSGASTSNKATYTWVVGDGAGAGASTERAASTAVESEPAAGAGAKDAAGAGEGASPSGACTPGIAPMIKDDRTVPATWRAPGELDFRLGDEAKKSLPSSVGPVPAGEAWMIGAVQEPGVPWLGANTQHPSMLDNQLGDATWELTSFEGPGPMVVFTQGGLGQMMGEEWFRGADGRAQGSHTIAPNTHVHPVWLFGAPGTYKVGIRQTAQKDGSTYSGADTLTFTVGGEGGNASDGHFDLGGVFDPAGGDCAEGSAAGGAQGSQASQGAKGSTGAKGALAETGASVMTMPYAVLGLGLLVFGAGVARFAVAAGRASR